MINNKNDELNKQILKIKDELDKVSVSSEVIEHLNQLINDKLDDINELVHDKDIDVAHLYNALRYNSNYITLNYLITQQLDGINKNIQVAFNLLNELDGHNNTDDTKE